MTARSRTYARVLAALAGTALAATVALTSSPTQAVTDAGSTAVQAPRPPAPADRAYATLLMGRTQWVSTGIDCEPLDGAVPLNRVATALTQRGVTATGNVVVGRTDEHERTCVRQYVQHPSWDDLAALRDTHGWSFISAGTTYGDMTTMTPTEQLAESCGSLPEFTSRGHTRAWGLFAYPNDKSTDLIQQAVVSTCFAYGRKYSRSINTRAEIVAPWFQTTSSVNGGMCNDPALPCHTLSVRNDRRYTLPETLARKFDGGPGTWAVVQWYRFVEGSSTAGPVTWDCTGADSEAHWTSKPELYCLNDFLKVVDAIPATTTVTDPATVATAWGRTL